MFPVYARVMALEPVMAEVKVLRSEVGDREVDAFVMLSDRQGEFDKLCHVSALIAGSIGIVHWYWYRCLLCVKLVLLDVCLIDGAPRTATVNQGFGGQGLSTRAGFQGHGDCEISGCSVDVSDRFTDFV